MATTNLLLLGIFTLTLIGIEFTLVFVHLLTPYRFFIMAGKSMRPKMSYLSIGYGVKVSSVSIGDVVSFKRRNKKGLIMHRVIGVSEGVISIKGDNAPEIDQVTMKDIDYKLVRFQNLI